MDLIAECVLKDIPIEDESVTIKKLSTSDSMRLEKIKDDEDRGIETLLASIVRWTFKNQNGQPIAINKDVIMRMRNDVITLIGIEIMKFNNPQALMPKENEDGGEQSINTD